MIKWLGLILFLVPMLAFGDARFVEAPAECHVPWDNNNVNNEFKLSGCSGVIVSKSGGAGYDVQARVWQENLNNGAFRINGEDAWDIETYPKGLKLFTSGAESGTACNVIDADGNAHATNNWTGTTVVSRGANVGYVNLEYWLQCWNATAIAQ